MTAVDSSDSDSPMPAGSAAAPCAGLIGSQWHDKDVAAQRAQPCAVSEREQLLQLLSATAVEIRRMRQGMSVLEAKVATFELCAQLGRSQGAGNFYGSNSAAPDLAWQLDAAVERARLTDAAATQSQAREPAARPAQL